MELLTPDQPQFSREVSTFNAVVTHAPDAVAAVRSPEDVAEALTVARRRGWRVSIQGSGHGAFEAQRGGLMIATRGLDALSLDPATRTAVIGAGVPWGAVIAEAAKHGLAPLPGSAPTVGAVGYLVGGGLGPLARSHGVSSDWVQSFSVVTARGDILAANPELLWALRGGKYCGVVVTSVTVRLAELPSLYAGSLMFDTPHLEKAFRGWLDWTATAHARVTTSAAMIRFPPREQIPAPLRGRRLLAIRFAFPGPHAEGAALAEPVRKLAPVYLDDLGPMAIADVARIHNDPPQPVPSAIGGQLLTHADPALAGVLLAHTEGETPIGICEVRHIGEKTHVDVPEGSAASGRAARYTLAWLGSDPRTFAVEFPAASTRLRAAIAPWRCPETLINFLGAPESPAHVAAAWSPATFARLEAVRRRYDPAGLLVTPWA